MDKSTFRLVKSQSVGQVACVCHAPNPLGLESRNTILFDQLSVLVQVEASYSNIFNSSLSYSTEKCWCFAPPKSRFFCHLKSSARVTTLHTQLHSPAMKLKSSGVVHVQQGTTREYPALKIHMFNKKGTVPNQYMLGGRVKNKYSSIYVNMWLKWKQLHDSWLG